MRRGHTVVLLLEGGHKGQHCGGRHSVGGGGRQPQLFENEKTFWKWKLIPKPILKMKICFWKSEFRYAAWPYCGVGALEGGHRRQRGGGRHSEVSFLGIKIMKPHTFWKWKHILKMKTHFENESSFRNPFWKWKHVFGEVNSDMRSGHTVVVLLEGGHRRQRGGGRHSVGSGRRQPQLPPPGLHVCWSSLLLIPV